MEYYSAIKNEILPFAAKWMDLGNIMPRRKYITLNAHIRKKEKYHMISLICGI